MPVAKLQKSSLKELDISPPSSSKIMLWDTLVTGLGAFKTSKGVVSLVYQYRMPLGNPQRIKLGNHGELTIDQARSMASNLAFQRRQGRGSDRGAKEAGTTRTRQEQTGDGHLR